MNPKEYKQMMDHLTRPRMARGGRIGFDDGGIANELKKFVKKFQIENNRIPTQNEIFKGTGRALSLIHI